MLIFAISMLKFQYLASVHTKVTNISLCMEYMVSPQFYSGVQMGSGIHWNLCLPWHRYRDESWMKFLAIYRLSQNHCLVMLSLSWAKYCDSIVSRGTRWYPDLYYTFYIWLRFSHITLWIVVYNQWSITKQYIPSCIVLEGKEISKWCAKVLFYLTDELAIYGGYSLWLIIL